jgi:hypothetical protein
MTDTALPTIERPRRFHFDWVLPTLFKPRLAFERIANQTRAVWLTPLLILTITSLISIYAHGWVRIQTGQIGQIETPPDFQYYSPEQQAQFMQAAQAQQGPVFVYVLPAIGVIAKVWFGWLIIGGIIHLVMTLMGGRGATGAAMNVVAWAGLAYALRDVVQIIYMLVKKATIQSYGLSGFSPVGEGAFFLFINELLALIDIYLIWYVLLIIVGVRAAGGLSRSKAIFSVVFTILGVTAIQALVGMFAAQMGNISIVRPFFF